MERREALALAAFAALLFASEGAVAWQILSSDFSGLIPLPRVSLALDGVDVAYDGIRLRFSGNLALVDVESAEFVYGNESVKLDPVVLGKEVYLRFTPPIYEASVTGENRGQVVLSGIVVSHLGVLGEVDAFATPVKLPKLRPSFALKLENGTVYLVVESPFEEPYSFSVEHALFTKLGDIYQLRTSGELSASVGKGVTYVPLASVTEGDALFQASVSYFIDGREERAVMRIEL